MSYLTEQEKMIGEKFPRLLRVGSYQLRELRDSREARISYCKERASKVWSDKHFSDGPVPTSSLTCYWYFFGEYSAPIEEQEQFLLFGVKYLLGLRERIIQGDKICPDVTSEQMEAYFERDHH